tara:strand:- start:2056 stop:2418 length:363 start_codon:yes stop_codon:yes gene_type:complete
MKKVLIAEDDVFIRDIAQSKLVKAGYEVRIVARGNQVIRELEQVQPDILLLDLMLPNKHGFEVLEEIRQHKDFEDLPVIIFSNETGHVVEERSKSLNAVYFFKAMTGTGELVDAVQSIMR